MGTAQRRLDLITLWGMGIGWRAGLETWTRWI